MQLMMSFVGGLMLGVALLHMLTHAVVATESLNHAAVSAVIGLLAMFFLIRMFHVHGHAPHEHHDDSEAVGQTHVHACAAEKMKPAAAGAHGLSWIGLFVGLALHTLIDGVALAAAVAAEIHEPPRMALLGIGTFLAVWLHKPLDALAITSVMIGGGWSGRWRNIVNLIFSLMCPLGALVFFFGVRSLGDAQNAVVGSALGFAAGAFLCISLADLLPEVQFHRHDRLKLSSALLLGVTLAWLIGFLEPEHAHSHGALGTQTSRSEHDHAHDHAHDHDE